MSSAAFGLNFLPQAIRCSISLTTTILTAAGMTDIVALEDVASSFGGLDVARRAEYHQMLQSNAISGDREAVEHMIALGLQWNQELTPVKQNPMHTALHNRDVELVQLLLGIENLAYEPNTSGETPLHLACRMNLGEVAAKLLAMGSDMNARDQEEGTPLYRAVHKRSDECVQLLIKAGCDLNTITFHQMTPIDKALMSRQRHLVSMLLRAGSGTEKLRGHVYYKDHEANNFFCALWEAGDLGNMRLFLDCGYRLGPSDLRALKATCHQLRVHPLERDTLELLRDVSERPQDLKTLCRLRLRRLLMERREQRHTPMDVMIDSFPVPHMVKQFLKVTQPSSGGEAPRGNV